LWSPRLRLRQYQGVDFPICVPFEQFHNHCRQRMLHVVCPEGHPHHRSMWETSPDHRDRGLSFQYNTSEHAKMHPCDLLRWSQMTDLHRNQSWLCCHVLLLHMYPKFVVRFISHTLLVEVYKSYNHLLVIDAKLSKKSVSLWSLPLHWE
jgi:hypothetical protein